MDTFKVIRATETKYRAGAYYVRIQAMAKQYHIPLEREFDEYDTPETKYILITANDFPVATCRFYEIDNDAAMIGRVVVLPEYRSRGLGKLAVNEAEKWLKELGLTKAVVESRDVAVKFYEKLGFTVADDKIIHGNTFDCIRMEKEIS